MKILENNITLSYPTPNHGERISAGRISLSSENFFNISVAEAQAKPKKLNACLLKFWASYLSIICINFANTFSRYTKENFFIMIVNVVSVTVLILIAGLAHRSPIKSNMVIFYSLTCVYIIITDPTVYSTFLTIEKGALSSLEFLIPLSVIFSKLLKKELYLFVSVLLGFTSLGLLIYSSHPVYKVVFEFLILAVLTFYNFFSFSSKAASKVLQDNNFITPLEEILTSLQETMNYLNKHIESCGVCEETIESSVYNISSVVLKLQTCKNIYSPRLEKITKNMDHEDKVFIEQNAHDSSPFRSFDGEVRKERRSTSDSQLHITKLGGLLKKIGKEWNFNTFFLSECTEGSPLEVSGLYIISKFKLDTVFGFDYKLELFFKELEGKYLPNPYHNSCHGADVMNSYIFFLTNSDLLTNCTDLELLAGVLSTLGHDAGHMAKNNRFLIMTKDALAIQYNDISVLENLHCTIVFQTIKTTEILKTFFYEQWCVFRKIVIEMILATDMSKHFDLLETFKAKYSLGCDLTRPDIRLDLFKIIIKASDIGHAAKALDLHKKWCGLVIEEFFQQGDEERKMGLPISMYCDRENTVVGKSQTGFIKNIVLPLFVSLNFILGSKDVDKVCIAQLEENKLYWERSIFLSRNQTYVDMIEKDQDPLQRRQSLPLTKN